VVTLFEADEAEAAAPGAAPAAQSGVEVRPPPSKVGLVVLPDKVPVKCGHAAVTGGLRPFGVSSVDPKGTLPPSGEAAGVGVFVCASTAGQSRSAIIHAAAIDIVRQRIAPSSLFCNRFIYSLFSSDHKPLICIGYNRVLVPTFHSAAHLDQPDAARFDPVRVRRGVSAAASCRAR
jgi:hypothetical protein